MIGLLNKPLVRKTATPIKMDDNTYNLMLSSKNLNGIYLLANLTSINNTANSAQKVAMAAPLDPHNKIKGMSTIRLMTAPPIVE